MNRFVVRLLIMAVLFAAALYALGNYNSAYTGTWSWSALIFFTLLTLFVNWLSERMLNKSQKTFMNFVYGATFLRFIFSIFFIVIYLIVNEVVSKYFIFSFGVFYLFFTSFEIYHLHAKLRAEK
ncbi:MAG: hypothetical protein H6608_03935 [Flavobacteriales bacterium]|nr:hypothetical protein [Bacteroidota bacterium]MCB9240258.1 hypothetical protein [Flavobacteriales bacterium]